MLVTDTPVTLEEEPNNDRDHAQPLTLPAVVSGRFDKERDVDWYAIDPTDTGPYSFEVYCERIAGQADPYLVVFDDKDARIAELDDFGISTGAFAGNIRDCSGVVNLTAKKKYGCGRPGIKDFGERHDAGRSGRPELAVRVLAKGGILSWHRG
jgi:hypothetical protein